MLGTIIGDMAGSRFEFNNVRKKDIPIYAEGSTPTDDTMMTVAVARAIMETEKEFELFSRGKKLNDKFYKKLSENTVKNMAELGKQFPYCGFGTMFRKWIFDNEHKPYESWGNGAAMRIGPAGHIARNEEEVKKLSRTITSVSHEHPEAYKGAECTAMCIFWLRQRKTKKEVLELVKKNYYSEIIPVEKIRTSVGFDASCQYCVPQAISCFIEGLDFEDTIRTAISSGGDSDTVAAIAGSIAQAYYEINDDLKEKTLKQLEKIFYKFIWEENLKWEEFLKTVKEIKKFLFF